LRAGFCVFPISVRNSPQAIAHLLEKTKTCHLLVGREDALKSLAEASLQQLLQDSEKVIESSLMPVFEDLYDNGGDAEEFEMLEELKLSGNTPAVYIHSSGGY
jgi:hypothetical protein